VAELFIKKPWSGVDINQAIGKQATLTRIERNRDEETARNTEGEYVLVLVVYSFMML